MTDVHRAATGMGRQMPLRVPDFHSLQTRWCSRETVVGRPACASQGTRAHTQMRCRWQPGTCSEADTQALIHWTKSNHPGEGTRCQSLRHLTHLIRRRPGAGQLCALFPALLWLLLWTAPPPSPLYTGPLPRSMVTCSLGEGQALLRSLPSVFLAGTVSCLPRQAARQICLCRPAWLPAHLLLCLPSKLPAQALRMIPVTKTDLAELCRRDVEGSGHLGLTGALEKCVSDP